MSRAWRVGLWTGVATAAAVEAFTRVYLSKHWFTDAVGGYLVGGLLLLVCATTVRLATAGVADSPVSGRVRARR
jgi:membrane-associated phospholipid phosphatase